jgi:hypothetical protein
VRHRCDNPPCVNPDHLLIGTLADNIHDMDSRGRRKSPRGTAHYHAKLTDAEVLAIRASYTPRSPTNGARALARKYGVSYQAVRQVILRNTWTHVEGGEK